MAWFKVDDELFCHPKWIATPPRARGLWVTAGSWCAKSGTDGRIPRDALRSLGGTAADASALVTSGLWREVKAGWIFHEWTIFQPDAASEKAKRKADSDAGTLGNHKRWHEKRRIVVPDCAYCQGLPPEDDEPPPSDEERYRPPDRVPDRTPDEKTIGSASPVPEPDPLLGLSNSGGSPKQRAGTTCPHGKPLGSNCGGCADARRADDKAKVDKERDDNRRQLAADVKARRDREAEAARTLAELEADPDAPQRGLNRAREALKAARSETKESAT